MTKPQDKKKFIVLGALAVCILGVGAFQFLGGGGAEPKKVATKKSKAKSEKSRKSEPTDGTVKTPHAAGKPAEGDVIVMEPDTSGDKATSPYANVEKSGATMPEHDPSKITVTEAISASGPNRDPFEVPLAARKLDPKKDKLLTPKPISSPNAVTSSADGTRIAGGRRIPPMPVGGLPPVAEGAPTGPIASNTPSAAGVNVRPGKVLRNEDEYSYSASGIVLGSQPMAVLQGEDGKQRLVRIGSSLGGGRVIAITSHGVVVDHKGKKVTLKVGGDSEKGQ